jgi:2-oxoglutarate ferredoxin oxidoreductase subunit delta
MAPEQTEPPEQATSPNLSDQPEDDPDQQPRTPPEGRQKKYYCVKFFYEWCKTCSLCAAMCPKKVILLDEEGRPYIDDMDGCIGCRNCEIHCPDFAVTVKDRHPKRRRTNGSA